MGEPKRQESQHADGTSIKLAVLSIVLYALSDVNQFAVLFECLLYASANPADVAGFAVVRATVFPYEVGVPDVLELDGLCGRGGLAGGHYLADAFF